MNIQKLLITLTAVNLALLGYQVFQPHFAGAATAVSPAVLRGTGLEIVQINPTFRGLEHAGREQLAHSPRIQAVPTGLP